LLFDAFERYPVNGLKIAVIGSTDQGYGPWYESICLYYGAHPITVEYNSIEFNDPRLCAITPDDLIENPISFDAALSISTFEHSGLGRYGDPIDPDGDLEAMRFWKTLVVKGGLMYLAVPIGRDKVIFNVHRIYGRKRLPSLIDQWDLIETFGYEDSLLDRDTKYGWNPRNEDGTFIHPEYPEYSPILVLRNP